MQKISIILERVPLESRWATHRWDLGGVVPDMGGEPRAIVESEAILRKVYPGFELGLYRDEAEGYYLNVSSEVPSVFVSLRIDEESGDPSSAATVAYVVRAVTPGSFVHPAATVEDMYRPDRFARTASGRLEITARE